MSIDLSIMPRDHGRDKGVLFSLIQDKQVIATAEIWHTQLPSPILEKVFVKKEARRHGLWMFLLEKRLTWLQENTTATTVEAYIPKDCPIIKPLQMNGFSFKHDDPDEEMRWMVKQLKI